MYKTNKSLSQLLTKQDFSSFTRPCFLPRFRIANVWDVSSFVFLSFSSVPPFRQLNLGKCKKKRWPPFTLSSITSFIRPFLDWERLWIRANEPQRTADADGPLAEPTSQLHTFINGMESLTECKWNRHTMDETKRSQKGGKTLDRINLNCLWP